MKKGTICQGIFEDRCRPLPDTSHVTLTEAITWLIADDCRDSAYMEERLAKVDGAWLAKWEEREQPVLERLQQLGAQEPSGLVGIRIDHGTDLPKGKHAPIQPGFFLRPIFRDRDKLGPRLASLSDGELWRYAVSGAESDCRDSYDDVRLKRDDVLKLKRLLRDDHKASAAIGPREGDQELKKRITSVVSYARGRWGDRAKRPPFRAMADHIRAQRKDQDFSKEALRKILSGSYPTMKRLGLKGIDG